MSPGDRCDQIIRLIDEALAVETMGLEPTTPCLQSRCSSQLSYVPERQEATRPPGNDS
jgi:hypothetical protein